MKLTEAFTRLLEEHARQAKDPSLWQDNAWKGNYYFLYNMVYDYLELPQKISVEKGKPSPWSR